MAIEKDIRFLRVEGFIHDAVIRLLQKKSFNQITVEDICSEAQISRSGFYLHYKDKYDLVDKYVAKMIKAGTASFLSNMRNEDFLYKVLKFLCGDGKLLALLISDNGSIDVQKMILYLIRENARENLLAQMNLKAENATELRYLTCYLSNASFGVLQEWISSGQKESAEELSGILIKIPASLNALHLPDS